MSSENAAPANSRFGGDRTTSVPFWHRPGAYSIILLLLILAPALWNGFPLIFADTGGYLARPFEGTLELGRSATYSVLLAGGMPLDFQIAAFAMTALIALVTNAAICGNFSNPNARCQSRLAPLATFALLIAATGIGRANLSLVWRFRRPHHFLRRVQT